MKRCAWKFALLFLVPLALYVYIAERNSWRPKTIIKVTGPLGTGPIKFSRDGRYLAVASRNSGMPDDLWIYDFNSKQVIKKFRAASLLAFLHPLSTLQTDKVSLIDEAKNRRCIYSLPNCKLISSTDFGVIPDSSGSGYESKIVAHSLDGAITAKVDFKQLVITLHEGKVVEPLREIYIYNGRTYAGHITGLDFSPDARTLCSANRNGTVQLWRIK